MNGDQYAACSVNTAARVVVETKVEAVALMDAQWWWVEVVVDADGNGGSHFVYLLAYLFPSLQLGNALYCFLLLV